MLVASQKTNSIWRQFRACLLLLLRIRSAHLGIFGFLKEFAPSYNNIFARFMTMWKKQILARVTRIQKENWG